MFGQAYCQIKQVNQIKPMVVAQFVIPGVVEGSLPYFPGFLSRGVCPERSRMGSFEMRGSLA
jgi:hypothetical protein